MPGAEDLAWSPASRTVYVSSQDRRPKVPTPRGALFAWDAERPLSEPRAIQVPIENFHPHGISVWRMNGYDRLFVVNHPVDAPARIEVLDVKGDRAQLVRSVTAPAPFSPNDLIAVGPDEFYVGSDHGVEGLPRQLWDDLTGRRRGYILHHDGHDFARVVDGIVYPNGLLYDARTRRLYVASTMGQAVHVYHRAAPRQLSYLGGFRVPGLADNLEWDAAGERILVGAHPSTARFLAHAASASSRAPSRVVSLDPVSGHVESRFEDDGRAISAVSVGVETPYGELFVGGVFDPRVLRCRTR